MALKDLLNIASNGDNKKMGLSEERVNAIIPVAREYISFWREYPDIFVEFLCGNNPNNFKLYFDEYCCKYVWVRFCSNT